MWCYRLVNMLGMGDELEQILKECMWDMVGGLEQILKECRWDMEEWFPRVGSLGCNLGEFPMGDK